MYGQEAASDLLRDAAERVQAIARPSDTIARIGPDSIGIVLDGSRSHEEVEQLATSALAAVERSQMSRAASMTRGSSLQGAETPPETEGSLELGDSS